MWAVIRIRGTVNVSPKIKKTLELLRLLRVHHCVLVNETPSLKKMVWLARDFLAYGEINPETLSFLLEKRGRFEGNKRISKQKLQELKLKDFNELALLVLSNKKKLREFGIKEVFRLNSPKKGFERKGIKKTFALGGVLGYRGNKINDLIKKMG